MTAYFLCNICFSSVTRMPIIHSLMAYLHSIAVLSSHIKLSQCVSLYTSVLRVDSNYWGSLIAHSRASSCQLLSPPWLFTIATSHMGSSCGPELVRPKNAVLLLTITIENRFSDLSDSSSEQWWNGTATYTTHFRSPVKTWRGVKRGCYCGGFADKRHLISAQGSRSARKIDLWNKSFSL